MVISKTVGAIFSLTYAKCKHFPFCVYVVYVCNIDSRFTMILKPARVDVIWDGAGQKKVEKGKD